MWKCICLNHSVLGYCGCYFVVCLVDYKIEGLNGFYFTPLYVWMDESRVCCCVAYMEPLCLLSLLLPFPSSAKQLYRDKLLHLRAHTHTHTTVCLYIHPFNSCCIAEQLGRTCPATFTCVLYISVSVYMCSVCLCVKCALSQHTWVINFQHGWVFTMAGCVCECVCAVGKVAAVNTNLVPEKTNVFNPWLSCPVLLSLPLSLRLSLCVSLAVLPSTSLAPRSSYPSSCRLMAISTAKGILM